ncbi:18083_t:CDS:2, partial [Funneliformis geosporum]
EKQEEKLRFAKGKYRCVGAERKEQYSEAEVSLKIWLIEFQKDGIAITPKMVKTHMKEILINQSRYSLQRKTKIRQKLPIHLDDKLLEFQ